MIPSLREPPFFLGDLGERLPRKDEIRPPVAAEEVAPGVWRGPNGKLFTQLETEEEETPKVTQGTTNLSAQACEKPFVKRVKVKEPLPDPDEEFADGLKAKTPLKREPKIGDKIRIFGAGISATVELTSPHSLVVVKSWPEGTWEFVF